MWSNLTDLMGGWQFKAIMLVFVTAIGLGIVYTYNHAITRAEQAEQDLKDANDKIEVANEQITDLNNRIKSDNERKKKLGNFRKSINEAKKDKTASEWLNEYIPTPITNILRDNN